LMATIRSRAASSAVSEASPDFKALAVCIRASVRVVS
jgi:hypothetical protein